MVDLGGWQRAVDVNEMLNWYALPGPLRNAYKAYSPDGHEFEPLASSRFSTLKREAERYADKSVAGFYVPHHNLKMHFLPAAKLADEAAKLHGLPEVERQILNLAVLTHDAHHCGATLRIHAKKLSATKYGGRNVAAEWITAAAVDAEFSTPHGLVVPARLYITYVHWASTIGGNSDDGKRLGIPSPKPKLISGRIMQAVDVCPPEGFMNCVQQAINVRLLEIPAEPRGDTWEWFMKDNLGYCDYVDYCFGRLGSVPSGWRSRVQTFRSGLQECLRDRNSTKGRQVDALLQKHGIFLR